MDQPTHNGPTYAQWAHPLTLDPPTHNGPTHSQWTHPLTLDPPTHNGPTHSQWTHPLTLDPPTHNGPTHSHWTHPLTMDPHLQWTHPLTMNPPLAMGPPTHNHMTYLRHHLQCSRGPRPPPLLLYPSIHHVHNTSDLLVSELTLLFRQLFQYLTTRGSLYCN